MDDLQRTPHRMVLRGLFVVCGFFAMSMLSGCLVFGVTSGGHFFLFPSLGVILVVVVLFALLRRR